MTDETLELIQMYAGDILNSDTYKIQKIYPHHRRVNVYEHELHVTEIAINLARNSKKDVNMRTLIRAAMLHDYYLYDWHKKDETGMFLFKKTSKSATACAERNISFGFFRSSSRSLP